MKKNHKKYIIFTILLLLQFYVSNASQLKRDLGIIHLNKKEYISLYDFHETFKGNSSYDIISGRGKIFFKGSLAVYQVGLSIMIIDNKIEKSDYPIAFNKGEILLPTGFFKSLIVHFYPDYIVERKGDRFYIIKKKEILSERQADQIQISRKPPQKKPGADVIKFIVLDPGHGGKDPGAVGKGGFKEKRITLGISIQVEKYLKRRLKGIKIYQTRKKDVFIELAKRAEKANKLLKRGKNGIFVSIHVNASIVKNISGFETYFLSQNPSNDDARTTAALENNVVILEEKTRKDTYSDIEHIQALMLTTQIQKESSVLANCIQNQLDKKIWESKSKGVKKADFFVLRGALMPAVLVEVGFISHYKEAKRLKNKKYQKKIAQGIGNGIIQFIKKYNEI